MQSPTLPHGRDAFRSPAKTRRSRLIIFSLALSATLLGEYLTIHGYTGEGRAAFLVTMYVLLLGSMGEVKEALGKRYGTGVELEICTRAVFAVLVLGLGCFVLV